MKIEVPMTKGYKAIIDEADADLVLPFSWYPSSRAHRKTIYAISTPKIDGRHKTIMMHRLIMGVTDPKITIDHEDHNGLHNWRSNLREASSQQQIMNQPRRKKFVNNTLFKGVAKRTNLPVGSSAPPWQAQIGLNGKQIQLGVFETDVDAAVAYDIAAQRLFGEFAATNEKLGLLPGWIEEP